MSLIAGLADWVVLYLFSQYAGLGLIGGYLLYRSRFKIGFKSVFLRKDVTGWCAIGEKEFKSKDQTVSFNKKDFTVKLEKLSYRKHGFHYLFFDFDSGELLFFGGKLEGLSPDDADLFLSSGIMERIMLGLKGVDVFTLMGVAIVLVAGVMCFAVGVLASPYILPQHVSNVTGALYV